MRGRGAGGRPVTELTTSLIVPSSVTIGFASFCVVTVNFQPGLASTDTPGIAFGAGGKTIWTSVVVARRDSLGTRNESFDGAALRHARRIDGHVRGRGRGQRAHDCADDCTRDDIRRSRCSVDAMGDCGVSTAIGTIDVDVVCTATSSICVWNAPHHELHFPANGTYEVGVPEVVRPGALERDVDAVRCPSTAGSSRRSTSCDVLVARPTA